MTWEWSHSPEAYADAAENVHNKPRDWLVEVYAEWQAKSDPKRVAGGFSQRKYKRALGKAKGRKRGDRLVGLPDDILADYICERMEEQRLCTSGGHKAWACPFGCVSHLVPFDHEETDAERAERERDEAADAEWEADALADAEADESDEAVLNEAHE